MPVIVMVIPDCIPSGLAQFGDSEVEDLGHLLPAIILRQDNISWLDIPMYEAQFMCGPEARADLGCDAHRPRNGNGPSACKDFPNVPALHQFHDDEGAAVIGVVEIVDSDRVGMTQFPGNDCFGLKSLQEVSIFSNGVVHDLDRADFIESEWRPRYTTPMPPTPIRARISYLLRMIIPGWNS